ncbi:uncharacterized protein FIBRA_02173 [Fibroporia radiculosa]|uniref:Uncharacterized protein n=1 Tax=Fibroporia radiculosa TaxID=599839 RepID=J4I8X0_9APHY|nr:uncharacterized protein FIBRA_02173 [Fibroporia radiculosa]CCM00146.1 predicted protein [Fibroporia radiculosa]
MSLDTAHQECAGVLQCLRPAHILPLSPPIFPIEICERIIDHLDPTSRNVANRLALLACALTCRRWYPRSRVILLEEVDIGSMTVLVGFARMVTAKPSFGDYVRSIHISNDLAKSEKWPGSRNPLTSFPTMLARKLTNLNTLHLCCMPHWDPAVHSTSTFYWALSEFTCVTSLHLRDIDFPSVNEFAHLIQGLPNLQRLACMGLRWTRYSLDPTVYLRSGSHNCLTHLYLDTSQTLMKDAVEFFVGSEYGAHLVDLRVGRLHVSELGPSGIGSLLQAAGTSLRDVRFNIASVVDADLDDHGTGESKFELL